MIAGTGIERVGEFSAGAGLVSVSEPFTLLDTLNNTLENNHEIQLDLERIYMMGTSNDRLSFDALMKEGGTGIRVSDDFLRALYQTGVSSLPCKFSNFVDVIRTVYRQLYGESDAQNQS